MPCWAKLIVKRHFSRAYIFNLNLASRGFDGHCGGLWNVRVTLFHPEWWSKLSGRDRGMETFRPVRPSYVRSLTPEPIKEKNEVLHLTYVTPPPQKEKKYKQHSIPSSPLFSFFHFPPLMLGKRRTGRGPLGLIPLQHFAAVCFFFFFRSKTLACKESCPEDADDSLHKHSGRHPGGRTLLRHPIGSDTWPSTVASPAGCLAAVWGYCWSRHGPLVCPSSLKQTGTFMKDQLTWSYCVWTCWC